MCLEVPPWVVAQMFGVERAAPHEIRGLPALRRDPDVTPASPSGPGLRVPRLGVGWPRPHLALALSNCKWMGDGFRAVKSIAYRA
jgi:hypothetical protein